MSVPKPGISASEICKKYGITWSFFPTSQPCRVEYRREAATISYPWPSSEEPPALLAMMIRKLWMEGKEEQLDKLLAWLGREAADEFLEYLYQRTSRFER